LLQEPLPGEVVSGVTEQEDVPLQARVLHESLVQMIVFAVTQMPAPSQ
jgi:hypothetical protein